MLVELVFAMEMGPSLSRPRMLEADGLGKLLLILRLAELSRFEWALMSIPPPSIS